MAIPTRYPDAVWRPPPGMYVGPVRQKTDLVIWHVDAGNAESLYGWWNQAGSGQNGSHFFVKKDGTVEQYAPIDRIVWTSGNGSLRSVGIETQGYAAGEWTPAQRAALIKLTRWLCSVLGIPRVMAPNSKLTSRGIGWHRQGVPATQAQKANKVSQTGGELWSSSVGKVCPGPDREKQIPHMVGEISGQTIGPPPTTEDDDMTPDQALQLAQVHAVLFAGSIETPQEFTVYQRLARMPSEIAQAIWRDTTVDRGGKNQVPAIQELADAKTLTLQVIAQNAALAEAVRQLDKGQTIDYDRIDATVRDALADGVSVDVTVGGSQDA